MERFDPFAPDVLPNPYPVYHDLRRRDPVHWGTPGSPESPGCWYLMRFDDVAMALKDARLGREVRTVLPPERLPRLTEAYRPLFDLEEQWMILRDPPVHTRLRRLVNKAFTPRTIETFIPYITRTTNLLLDDVQQAGRMDVIADFARQLPVMVIAEILGIPVEDRRQFMPWSITLAAAIELRQTPEVYARGTQAAVALVSYLRQVIAERARNPRDDLISHLIAVEDAGSRLSEDEILGTITLLLTAGNDPTMHLIGNSMLALLRHPDQRALLRTHPELIEQAIDELLRYDSSVQMTFRYALEDVKYGGKTLRAGDHIAIVFGAANRDPAHYPDPDQLDLTRKARRYIPFGLGIHYCIGAALARIEGQIAISTLLRRFPSLALAVDPGTLAWQETASVRGLKRLPVVMG